MSEQSSYRRVVRSTGIIGGAQLGMLAIGLVRSKIVALLVGPSGIGLLGLYNGIVTNGAAIAAMGIGSSGVREIADPAVSERVSRHGVATLSIALAMLGACVMFLLRNPVSHIIAGDGSFAAAIGWLAVAVGLSVISTAVAATLQGLRRLRNFAAMNVVGTAFGAAAGILLIWRFGHNGILPTVIAAPLALVIVGVAVLARVPPSPGAQPARGDLQNEWARILKLGIGVMAAATFGSAAQLGVRTIILQRLGLEAVGLYQSAAALTTVNVGLVLTAMGTDYYPSLSQAAGDRTRMSALLNQHLHVALLLAAPILIAVSSGAAFWLHLLYSSKFLAAEQLLRWQLASTTLGDLICASRTP
jgi:PST family polysaccharide transporter